MIDPRGATVISGCFASSCNCPTGDGSMFYVDFQTDQARSVASRMRKPITSAWSFPSSPGPAAEGFLAPLFLIRWRNRPSGDHHR